MSLPIPTDPTTDDQQVQNTITPPQDQAPVQAPAASVPSAPNPQPQSVSNAPQANAQPQQDYSQHPMVRHASIIRSIAESLAGGPRYKTIVDSNTGETKRVPVPLDRKDIGMAIAMSAIEGGLAGLQARGPNASAQAAGLGFGAVAQRREQAYKDQDAQASADFARKMQLTEHNMHMMQMTAALGHENEDLLQKHVDAFSDMRDEQGTPALADVSESDLRTKYAGQAGKLGEMASKYLALPSKVVPVLDSNGQPTGQSQLLWNFYDQTKQQPLTQEFLNKAASYGVPGSVKSDGTSYQIPENATISAPAYAKMVRQMESADLLQNDVDEVASATKTEAPSVKALLKSGQLSFNAINQYFRDHGAAQNPADAVALMAKDPKASSYAPSIVAAFGPDAFTKYKDAQAANKEGAIEGAKKAADAAAEANGPLTDDKAASILSDPNATPIQKSRAQSFQNIKAQQKAAQKQNESAADQAAKQGNAQDAGKLLYNGTLTLSELKARSVTPKFIEDATNAALVLARANGENNWTPQTAEAQFNAAKSTQNVQFFGSANSLLDKDGTLNQLSQQYAKLGNGKIPLFNKWEDYAKYEAGDPALAGFMQTAVGVADDYAKVMGGGTGSDTSRLQVMQSFANSHNPQQMQSALDAARNAVTSQVSARIGKNRVMQQMYGQNVPSTPVQKPRVVPAGATPGRDAQGNVIGYRTADGQVVRF